MRNRQKFVPNNLNYQSLEPRQLLAGDVSVSLNQDILEVTGDVQANEFQIVGTANGQAQVIAPTGTTINGNAGPFVANVALRNVVVRLNGGDDMLSISGLVLKSQLIVEGGDGNDSINIGDINVRNLTVDGGDGNDVLQFHNVFSARDLRIQSQAGDDTISITALTSNTLLAVDTGAGADLVAIDNLGVRKAIDLSVGDGDDRVFMTGLIYGYNTNIFLGTGNDTLSIVPQTSSATATFWRTLTINSGEGDDSVFLGASVESRGKTTLDGAAGNDSSGTSGAMLNRPQIIGIENQQLANLNAALETFYADVNSRGVDTTPFGRVPAPIAPVLSVSDSALTIPANAAATVIDNLLTLTANDRTSLTGATVRVGSNVSGEDVLAFVNTSKITHAFDAATGTLTLTGSATAAEYQAALRTVTYDNTRATSLAGTKQIIFTINSSGGTATDARALTLQGLSAPTLALSDSTLSVPKDSPAVAIDSQLTLSGSDGTIVSGATVVLSAPIQGQDVLAFTNTGLITGTYDSATGRLTLTGSATLAQYQVALRTVTFDTTSVQTLSKRADFTVNSNATAATDFRNISVLGLQAITLSIGSTSPLIVPANSAPVVVSNALTLGGDIDTIVNGATIRITTNIDGQDTLAFVNTAAITGVFNDATGTLTLSGAATLSAYQAALRTITYDNTLNPSVTGSRQIEFTVTSNAGTANAARTLNLEGLPVLSVSNTALKHFGNSPATAVDNQLTLNGGTSVNVSQARVIIAGSVVNENVLAFTNTAKITGVFHAPSATLTLTGNATLAEYQAALRTVTYDNTSTTTLESTRKIDFAITSDLGPVTASRDIDLGDQLAIRQFATANSLTTQVTSSGLHFIIDAVGNGTQPAASNRVRVNYVGTLLNGTQFDAGNSVTFSLNGVIAGWQEGIPLLSVGGSGRLIVPSSLAYGPTGQGSIPANTVLIFDIDLLEIVS